MLTCLSGFIEQGESIEEAVSPSSCKRAWPLHQCHTSHQACFSAAVMPAEPCYLVALHGASHWRQGPGPRLTGVCSRIF